ncbi:dihydrolipoamide acetyltransferase family protein [Desmospora profundinema]|uniref:Dihydrolipoamide acetyltransferase component of pyruvate dehydrogenase complex n=1 Tax=Desmospora profundinema TaxID=1571184 RepID=A0ABU1IMD8_9BACL|nr:dihydrolipoamide acetyltransferase family protein [Desmospora profundinema]MDR6225943.1 pyruvate dehydrogenase E2 component (dihydrolipoamide acetyltransferase) [Desmospora profundinema]
MAFEFKLPDVGEGIHEGEIVKFYVKEGDSINEDDVLAEVQTDKAVVEIPSPVTGTVKKLNADEGEVVEVGSVLAVFDTGDGDDTVDEPTEEEGAADQDSAPAEAKKDKAPAAPAAVSGKQVLAMPSVRKKARELGLELTQVEGTGPRGRITFEDLENFQAGGTQQKETQPERVEESPVAEPKEEAAPAAVTHVPQGNEERIPLRGMRRTIAKRMAQSVYTAPHVTIMDEVDASEMIEMRKWAKPMAEQRGIKLTYMPFIVKALVAALREFPTLNASIDDEKEEIIIKKYYNMGIATATEDGLVVPVLKDVDRKSIFQLADEMRDLVTRTRDRKAGVDELKGGTFTITNIGSFGGQFFTPIINYPEVAIFGMGKMADRPMAVDGEVVIKPIMNISLSIDHRLIDGDVAARFLNRVKELLENPKLLMMEMS